MVLAILIFVVGLAVLVAVESRRRKLKPRNSELIGAQGLVTSTLSPEGAILIDGELWRARSIDQRSIPATANVRVVNVEDHLLLVERRL